MRAEKRGILLTKSEITALLEFAMNEEARDLSRVRFFVHGDRCWAYASDGRRAVEADGEASDELAGEWAIERAFLDAVRKLLDGSSRAVLLFSGASLHEARIETDETGDEIGALTWPHDAANSQVSIDALRKAIKIPRTMHPVRCLTVPATQLSALASVAKAAQWDSLDVYPPKSRDEPLAFRVEGGPLGTSWTGVIMPIRADEETPDEKADRHERRRGDPRQTDLPGTDDAIARAVQDFVDACEETGSRVTFGEAGKEPVVIADPDKPRRGGDRKARKKTSRRRA